MSSPAGNEDRLLANENDDEQQQEARGLKRQRGGSSDDEEGPAPEDEKKEAVNDNARKDTPEAAKGKGQSKTTSSSSSSITLPWAQRYPDVPISEHYHLSYMHAAVVTHVVHNGKHGYVVTASADGVVKFWKRLPVAVAGSDGAVGGGEGGKDRSSTSSSCLEFVKSFAAHDGPVGHLAMDNSCSQDFCCSIGANDGLIKFYDVRLFDSVSMIQTNKDVLAAAASSSTSTSDKESTSRNKQPTNVCLCEWFRLVLVPGADGNSSAMTTTALAVTDTKAPGSIFIYAPDDDTTANDEQSSSSSSLLQKITLHGTTSRITALAYNPFYHCMISTDEKGIIEIWDCHNRPKESGGDGRPDGAGNTENDGDDEMEELAAATRVYTSVGGPLTAARNGIKYTSKFSDTQLYELVQKKTFAVAIAITPTTGDHFCIYGADHRIRIFHHQTGKIVVTYDERLKVYDKIHEKTFKLDAIEYGKRSATEREINQSPNGFFTAATSKGGGGSSSSSSQYYQRPTIEFDPSGRFLLVPTLVGIKIVDWRRNKLLRITGKADASQLRFLSFCLCPGVAKINRQMFLARQAAARDAGKQASSAALTAAQNRGDSASSSSEPAVSDALIIALAYNQRRLYVFSHVDPVLDPKAATDVLERRDIWNEAPTSEDQLLLGDHAGGAGGTAGGGTNAMPTRAILRTTMGDIYLQLFSSQTPKTIENFCGHAKSGYYNGVIFHRVIKGFMLQTGDPQGDGTGGESIWGGEFEDEFVPGLRHDRPFTVSMANAGPGTNGSQFFITCVPCPWLDNKHTVFGRVQRGADICTLIENVKTNENDKPLDEIKILSIDVE